jgi:hypothetical protein
MTAAPTYRAAQIGDASDIYTLLLVMAADIPLAVETLEQEEALYAALRKILAFGQSWVAVNGNAITGFVLIDSAEVGRHWGENELLNLRYAAGEAVDELLGKVLERRVPITASVRETNRTGLAARLERCGFRSVETRTGETRFRHDP